MESNQSISQDEQEVLDHFEQIIEKMNKLKTSRGELDARAVSIAITHAETARLWFRNCRG